jgi:hypothetical protein
MSVSVSNVGTFYATDATDPMGIYALSDVTSRNSMHFAQELSKAPEVKIGSSKNDEDETEEEKAARQMPVWQGSTPASLAGTGFAGAGYAFLNRSFFI